MPIRLRTIVLAALALMGVAGPRTPAAGQADILLRLQSGSPAGDRFRVDSAGGVVAKGEVGIGIIPQSGPGWRMMWYPFKTSFRAGAVTGTEWDDANNGFYSWAGGLNTIASGQYALAMGFNSDATNNQAVAFGINNTASGTSSFVGGQDSQARSLANFAYGANAWAGTSFRGAPNSNGSAVAIGSRVTADASWSMALGNRATTAGHVGSFVWGGNLNSGGTTDSVEAIADGEFVVRAPGGIRMRSNLTLTTGCNLGAGGGAAGWTCASSRTLKENPVPVDGEELLAKIRALPVNRWSWIESPQSGRHIGPFAEDFHRAFGVGGVDSMAINGLDADGVNLAGVKALEARTTELRTANERLAGEIGALREENAELRRTLSELLARMEKVESSGSR